MRLTKVTFTGIDDSISDINELNEIASKYSFTEFGILFSVKRLGTPRYPSIDWQNKIYDSIDEKKSKLKLSGHLCGEFATSIMIDDESMIDDIELSQYFGRFQININIQKHSNYKSLNLISFINKHKNKQTIIQSNENNQNYVNEIIKFYNWAPRINDNLHILYDTSGGNGEKIKTFKEPYEGIYTGYAGGITIGNVKETIENILQLKSQQDFWIDMESGLRTIKDNKDVFDLNKVEKICEICKTYI